MPAMHGIHPDQLADADAHPRWVCVCRTGGDLTAAEMKHLQHARLDKLTVNLTIILKRWVAGDCDGFKVRRAGLVTETHKPASGMSGRPHCRPDC